MQASSVVAAPNLSTVVAAAAALVAAMLATPAAVGQQSAPKAEPKAQLKGQPKVQPKSGAPKAAAAEQPKPGDPPQLVYTPWTKVCQKGPEPNSRRICLTGKDGRVQSGGTVVGAVIIESEGLPKKILRVTLPLGMVLQPGTRVMVDQGQPINAPYVICIPGGCAADYEASEELIGNLKRGQNLHVQGINASNQPISLALPLGDFAKAYDGPPSDPKSLGPSAKPR